MKKGKENVLPDEAVINKIFFIRGQKVMLDRDLAELYGVETRTLNQAVKRNIKRFPADFMFRMTSKEFENWRSQFVISNSTSKGLRYAPFCFTEQGVTMLSCVLNSLRAIDVNIRVIRIFSRLREALLTNKDLLLKIEQLEKQVVQNSEDVKAIFAALRRLLDVPKKPLPRVGYRTSHSD